MTEKIRVTVVVEYVPNLDHYYSDAETVEDAMRFDARENPFQDYPSAYLENPDELMSVTYEVVSAD
ncbi:hypothetical protein ACIRJ3_05140 [Streptomyces anulatus]